MTKKKNQGQKSGSGFPVQNENNTYEGHGYSVSGSSLIKRSWSFAHESQWPDLLQCRFGIGSSHKWHSMNRGPQQKAKQHDNNNQNTHTQATMIIQVWNGSSRCAQGSIAAIG